MEIGLFIPCYINQFYPEVAKATLKLLQKYGNVTYPLSQTCCGQPMANSGCEKDGVEALKVFYDNFKDFDYVVGPSASCVLHVREHGAHLYPIMEPMIDKVFDLTEFIYDVMKEKELQAEFPHKVAIHKSCHGLRGMRLGQCSERVTCDVSKQDVLVKQVSGVTLIQPKRADECCGFGGTFSVSEPDISVRMGTDRLKDYIESGAEYITSGDMSCLMHLDGIIQREKLPIKVIHLAEILAAEVKSTTTDKEKAYVNAV
ncbi:MULTISPECIES: (Fe-S)-binding protein [Flammeovirga]|uniref:(Fe-S)-binding protein n=1 Tax=Flammeovirga aprica JL-4 TaxID=694437 RepID=A0A7X9RTP8_9BACT|nr:MULTISPECIES: (Fe-S)-binding protein [Flammeovirga]KXX68214.1 Fe-S oxidoreductase [Flammeovirga sp. SJP92]NME68746.1 (Fe-S)-binding protein [Flammeovirga aprica JL-4]